MTRWDTAMDAGLALAVEVGVPVDIDDLRWWAHDNQYSFEDLPMDYKEHLVHVAETLGISQADVDRVLDMTRDRIHTGERFEYPGLGVFTSYQRDAYTARNPRNGEPVEVPEQSRPKFSASSRYIDALNTPSGQ